MEEHAKIISLNFRHFNQLLIMRGSPALLPGPKALKQAENRPVTSFVWGRLCSLIYQMSKPIHINPEPKQTYSEC